MRLWGPLWTHSAFGFESMNGHLRDLIHSRTEIHKQLVFSVQVNQALQQLHSHLLDNEGEETINFLSYCRHAIPRQTMSRITAHTYIVGKICFTELSEDELSAVATETLGELPPKVETFYRLYHRGDLYYSTSYQKENGKRNCCVCCYRDEAGNMKFGQIQKFCQTTKFLTIMKVFTMSSSTFLRRAGNPGRRALQQYAEVDLLSSFMFEVYPPSTTLAIPIEQLQSRCVLVTNQGKNFDYIFLQPNNFQHF